LHGFKLALEMRVLDGLMGELHRLNDGVFKHAMTVQNLFIRFYIRSFVHQVIQYVKF
jgi:hypothetical protein